MSTMKVTHTQEVNGREELRAELIRAVNAFVDEGRNLVVIGAGPDEPMIRIAGLDSVEVMAMILSEANRMVQEQLLKEGKADPMDLFEKLLKELNINSEVFVEDGKDLLKKSTGGPELIQQTLAAVTTFINDDKNNHWVFVNIPRDEHATVMANVDVGGQLDILTHAIENIKRIGQKA
ncbi:MAG: hypothetical protein KKH61_21210 [Gammaproteobacteria bacterium]|uniref:Uncharacterized protein n=1 Tax=viral metagenome TaxID=1070528 RepID=A0A6H1Z9Q1_9ZZZZ|nr:hypothetical protein [Gammaproteobacteria bacterium]